MGFNYYEGKLTVFAAITHMLTWTAGLIANSMSRILTGANYNWKMFRFSANAEMTLF